MDHQLLRGRDIPCFRHGASHNLDPGITIDALLQVDGSKGYKGITCFVVEKDMGIKIAKKEQKLGIRASSTCTLDFDDVKVPLENVVGGEGKGYKVALLVSMASDGDIFWTHELSHGSSPSRS